MSAEELKGMTVDMLRAKAREVFPVGKSRIVMMNREELVNALMVGALPGDEPKSDLSGEPTTKPKNGNGKKGPGDGADLVEVLAAALSGRIKSGVDEDQVKALVSEALSDDRIDTAIKSALDKHAKVIEVKVADKPAINVGRQHQTFETILKLAACRINIMMVGPAGSGKTTAAEAVARALSLPFYCISVGMQTTKSDLLGYMDANGHYVRSLLREAFENGGIFLMDEIDAGNGNTTTIMNSLLANGVCAFPDGMIKKHPDFIFIAAGNTFGRGADRVYVGRNPIDGATIDRFCFVPFDYDEGFEMDLSADKSWCAHVQKIRNIVFDLKEKLVVSPRASIHGSVALANGFTWPQVADMFIYRGVNKEVRERIVGRLQS